MVASRRGPIDEIGRPVVPSHQRLSAVLNAADAELLRQRVARAQLGPRMAQRTHG